VHWVLVLLHRLSVVRRLLYAPHRLIAGHRLLDVLVGLLGSA
jgi:hypothetical protein